MDEYFANLWFRLGEFVGSFSKEHDIPMQDVVDDAVRALAPYSTMDKIQAPEKKLGVTFAVVTELPAPGELPLGGNHSVAVDVLQRAAGDKLELVAPSLAVQLFQPVFQLGELLVLDENDRCIWSTRKPGKWAIKLERFDTLEEAIERSREVVEDE